MGREMTASPTSLGRLYTTKTNIRASKALIAAKYSKVELELVEDYEMGVTNKSSEYLSRFPLGKIPALETPHGSLFESNAIALYVAEYQDCGLLGSSPYEKALVHQWISFSDAEISSAASTWVYPLFGLKKFDRSNCYKAQTELKESLSILDNFLKFKTFLVGERITLADITLTCSLTLLYKLVMDAAFRKPYPNVNRWFDTCVNQPEFEEVLGKFQYCKVPQEPQQIAVPKKEKEKSSKDNKKTNASMAPKLEKMKEKAKKDEADDDFNPAAEALALEDEKPKQKNPLDLLPPSKLKLDDWKKMYSNNDTRTTAIPWFWENYDPDGFCIYKLNYKYNHELTRTFMSSNLIGGFFQRLESARKYAFGSMIVTGEDNNSEITGYFIFRGTDIPFEVRDCPDSETFDFTKIDPSDPAVKQSFEDYLAWDGNLDGKTYVAGKIFK